MAPNSPTLYATLPEPGAVLSSVGAMGNVTTQTLKAFTEDEFRKIIGSLALNRVRCPFEKPANEQRTPTFFTPFV